MNILIIGASSAIADACAKLYAQKHRASFFLVARDEKKLQMQKQDLKIRGAFKVDTYAIDLADQTLFDDCLSAAFQALEKVDIILMAQGVLGDQAKAEKDLQHALQVLDVNGISQLALLTLLANRMQQQGSGTIAVISSVAGDRGRPSNYVYGTSKAMVTTFLQGLRARLFKYNVNVLTIKPGFVDTPMTDSIDKSGPLWAQPEDIAEGIAHAIASGKSEVYLPRFWGLIMFIIKSIPEFIFKRLSL